MSKKEQISIRQGIVLISMFTAGNSILLVPGRAARQDVWISNSIALIAGLMMVYVYAKILSFFPGMDLFDILKKLFGKIFSRMLIIIFVWNTMFMSSAVFRTFWEFIRSVGLPRTPPAFIIFCMIFLCIWVCREGLEVLGRWAEFFFIILSITVLITVILSSSAMNLTNLLPVKGVKPQLIIEGSINAFTFPFAENVVFMMVFSNFDKKNGYYKVFSSGLLLGGAAVILISIINVTILGPNLDSSSYFPSYTALSRISIGDFIQRYEIAMSVIFLVLGFVKLSICLLAASKGISKLFNLKDYRFIVIPIGIMISDLSFLAYKNQMEMFSWPPKYWAYAGIPFEVIWPLIIYLTAAIKNHNKNA